MTQEIESVKPTLTVILDDGDFIINSTGPIGKLMAQAILPAAAGARRVTVISDGEMKVMKRNGNGANTTPKWPAPGAVADAIKPPLGEIRILPDGPDIQDQFAADLEAGVTGEIATGEVPAPTPGPNAPTPTPTPAPGRRKPQIFQDAAAPPAPELAVAEMDRLLEEAAQAERDQMKVAEERRFQAQQAVQAGAEATDADPNAAEAAAKPRKREPRNLATTGRACGRCGGAGQVMGDAGFTGHCPVCMGAGQIKTWDRAIRR